jgi:TonB family protein
MVQHPAQFDPSAALALSDASAASNDPNRTPASSSIANVSSAILADGTGNVSADMALDLVLTDVVEQARLATGATAAAVALRRGSEIFCRATSGPNAPDLGSRLDQYSGLSGACVQSKTFQKCDDSESDPRVDAALCRRLGIRSILVSPIVIEDRFLGVVEVFSPKPHAFTDREVQTTQALARIIVHNVEHLARAVEVSEPLIESLPEMVEPEVAESEVVEPEIVKESPQVLAGSPQVQEESPQIAAPVAVSTPNVARPHDHWTTALIVLVILVAIALGWLVEYVAQKRARLESARSTASQVQAPAAPTAKIPNASSDEKKPVQTAPSVPIAPSSEKTRPRKAEPAAPSSVAPGANDLVVYQDGKVIYRQPKSGPSESANSRSAKSPVFLSPEVANQLLIQRVEPAYPQPARDRQIQGPVTLQISVGKDGVVQSASPVSGDDELATAAAAAVRQWRFKPFVQKGKAQDFQTEVTVEFHLR